MASSTCFRLKASSCRVSTAARSAVSSMFSMHVRCGGPAAGRASSRSAVAQDDGQDVVEVVRDAAGQPADRLHLLELPELLLALRAAPPRRGGDRSLSGDVTCGGSEAARAMSSSSWLAREATTPTRRSSTRRGWPTKRLQPSRGPFERGLGEILGHRDGGVWPPSPDEPTELGVAHRDPSRRRSLAPERPRSPAARGSPRRSRRSRLPPSPDPDGVSRSPRTRLRLSGSGWLAFQCGADLPRIARASNCRSSCPAIRLNDVARSSNSSRLATSTRVSRSTRRETPRALLEPLEGRQTLPDLAHAQEQDHQHREERDEEERAGEAAIGARTAALGWFSTIVHRGVENWTEGRKTSASRCTRRGRRSTRSVPRCAGPPAASPARGAASRAEGREQRMAPFVQDDQLDARLQPDLVLDGPEYLGLTAPCRIPRSGCARSSARLTKKRTRPSALRSVDSTVFPIARRACCWGVRVGSRSICPASRRGSRSPLPGTRR